MVVERWRLALLLLALGAGFGACGSDSGDDNKPAGNAGGGAVAAVGTDLDSAILFHPMYSGYDGGAHDFKVPAIVNGFSGVRWEADPKGMVDLEPMGDNSVMITTRAAGQVRIIARSGSLSGSAMLNITEYKPEDWTLGESRYNNMVPLPMLDRTMLAGFMIPHDLSCKNCHGSGAMALSVEHTPQQTGGYSDDDILKIVTMGMKPAGATFHTGIPPFIYQMVHTWNASEEEKRGILSYLRSMTPTSQGEFDFGGLIGGGRGSAGAAAP